MEWSRETKIVLDAQGRWFEDGVLVENPQVVAAFNRWIAKAPDGRYCLKNSVNWAYVEVQGAPVFVESLSVVEGGVELHLSDERVEVLSAPSLRQDAQGALYCDVRGGELPAKFSRRATFELAPLLDEDAEGVFLMVGAHKVRPPLTETPLHTLGRTTDT